MSDESSTKKPDWYPHPDDAGLERWWDGRDWTDFTRPTRGISSPATESAGTRPAATAAATAQPASRAARRGVPIVAVFGIAAGALIVGAIGGAAAGAGAASIGRVAAIADSPSVAPATDAAAEVPTAEPSEAFQYDASTMTIKLKVLSKECFGSAGCNVNVQPVLSVDDPSVIPDDASGSITYEITGGEDGPVIQTVDISGTQYSPDRNVISTSSSGKKLHVKITDVTTNS